MQIAVGLTGEQGRGAVVGQLRGEVVAQERGAEAGDEEAHVVAFEPAEEGAGSEEEDAGAVDRVARGVECGLDGAGGGPVGLGRFVAQGQQQIQVRDAGNGGAPRNAAVEVGTVQPRGAERIGDPGAGRLDHGGEHHRHAAQRALASDRPVLGEASVAQLCVTHTGTLPRSAAGRERFSQLTGAAEEDRSERTQLREHKATQEH